MKKLLIALLALSVAGATVSAADAPALKLSGYFNTGFEYNAGDATDPATLSMYARDADASPAGYRFNLNGAYDAGIYGVNFRFRAQQTSNVFMPYVYGWMKFGSMVKVMAGIVDNGTFNSMGDIDGDAGEGTGLLAIVTPMDGLDLGVGVFTKDAARQTASNAAYELEYTNFTYSAAYTMKDTFKAVVSTDFQKNDDTVAIDYDSNLTQLRAGLKLMMVPKLSAVVELQLSGGNVKDKQLTTIAETLEYAVDDAITAGLVAYQYSYEASNSDFGFSLNPWVSYAMGALTPKLSVVYAVNDGGTGTSDDTLFKINPSAKYALDAKASVTFGAAYSIVGEAADVDNNQFDLYADFLWSF